MLLNLMMFLLAVLFTAYMLWRVCGCYHRAFSCSLSKKRILKVVTILFVLAASLSLWIWHFIPSATLAAIVNLVGNYWLGFLMEFLTCLLFADLSLIVLRVIRKRKMGNGDFTPVFYKGYGAAVLILSVFLTALGCINAQIIRTNHYEIRIGRKKAAVRELNVILVADLHLGYSIGCTHMQEMVDKINREDPDLVIFAGDLFDNDHETLENPKELAGILRGIHSRYGVYGVYGNHDVSANLVGGFTVSGSRLRHPKMEEFCRDSNIQMLLDDVVEIANQSIYLVGRVDGKETGHERERKSLEKLTQGLDPEKPLFVINHEPEKLSEYASQNVDVLFSGHTHDGQTFPLTLANSLIWENSHGCKKVGDMYSLVTSGVGIFGPNMRVFTTAEVMQVTIRFP